MWEHHNQRRITYPKPRYSDQIVMRPQNYEWQAVAGAPGVLRKPLGDFTERHVTVEMLRVEPGATGQLGPRAGTLACVVVNGAGTVEGKPAAYQTSVKVESGAAARVATDEGIEIVLFGLPIFDVVASPAGLQRETVNA